MNTTKMNTTKTPKTRVIARRLCYLFLAGSAVAHAQRTLPPTLDDPYYASVMPKSGAYYDPSHSGSGMFVDMRANGSAFIVLGTYDANGLPTWYTMQGSYVPTFAYSNVAGSHYDAGSHYFVWDFAASLGVFEGKIYRSEGGQCPGCAYTAPVTTAADDLGSGRAVWTAPGQVTLSVAGATSTLVQLPLDNGGVDAIEGRWHLAAWIYNYPDSGSKLVDATVTLQAVAPVDVVTDLDTSAPRAAPEEATHWFRVLCEEDCDTSSNPDFWRAYADTPRSTSGGFYRVETYIWIDSRTGKAGLGQYERADLSDSVLKARDQRFEFEARLGEGVITGRRSQATDTEVFGITGIYGVEGSLLRMERIGAASN